MAFKYRAKGRQEMTISEKLFAMHGADLKGEFIQVRADWVLAPEAS
jgi:hypothetical protein